MAEREFWNAAFLAFLGLCLAGGLALYHTGQVTSRLSKTLCWCVPVSGALMMAALVYAAFGMNNGGFSGFAFPLLSIACYVFAGAFPGLQLALGLVARASDQGGA